MSGMDERFHGGQVPNRLAAGSGRLLAGWLVCSWTAAAVAADPPLLRTHMSVEGGIVRHERARDQDGSLASDWQMAEARLFLRPHPALRLGIGLGLSRDGYDPEGWAEPLPSEVHHAWLRVPVALMVHPHWGMTIQGSVGSGTDGEASTHSGRQWQIQGGPLYRRDDDLIIALLVNVSSRIGEEPTIFPFPSLYWRFHPDWRLTVVDDVDQLSHLRWQVRADLDLGLRMDVRLREAALEGDEVLVDDHVTVALQATWMPFGRDVCEVTPLIGTQLIRRLAIRSDEGEERWSLITRPAPLVGLHVRASF